MRSRIKQSYPLRYGTRVPSLRLIVLLAVALSATALAGRIGRAGGPVREGNIVWANKSVGDRTSEVDSQVTKFRATDSELYANSPSFNFIPFQSCTALPSGAVGWWNAEGNANDALGSNNGVLHNGTSFSTGLVGQAFSFDGVDDYVSINRSIQDDFTIEFWLNTTQVVGTDDGQWYEGMGLVDAEVRSVTNDFGVTLRNGRVFFGVGNPDVTIKSGFVSDGNWHHVAATRLRSTGEMRLYVDGLQVASANAGTQSLTAPPRITMGQVQVDNNPYQGKLDEVTLYSRVLSAQEVQAIYNANVAGKCTFPANCKAAPSNLVAWWRAENNANDTVGNHHGSLQNATFTVGNVGQGFKLNQTDGTLDQVSIPSSPDLCPANFTIETWVKFDTLDTPNASAPGLQYIMFKKNTRIGNFEGYDLHKVRVNGEDKLSTTISAANGTFATVNSQTSVVTGQFYHVAASHDFDGTTGTLKLYVNGVLEGSASANFPPDYDTRPVFLGSSGESFFNGYLNGVIDEASIYDRVLSQAEIQSIYSAGNAGKCGPGSIQSLTLSPNPVNGGEPSTGTVTLTTAAPTGGTVINLSTSDADVATVPSFFTIAAGQTTGTFSVSTLVPATDTSALITTASQTGSTSASLTVLSARPDLTVSSATVPSSIQTDAGFNISWTDTNQGTAQAAMPWTDRVWLSNDNQLGNDTLIGDFPFNTNLEPNQTADRIQTISIPRNAISQDGSYYLLIQTEANNQINEGIGEGNNIIAQPINVTRQPHPDLVVDNVVAPNTAFFGQSILVQWTVKNIGLGPTNAQGWQDFVYLSLDNVPELEDPFKLPVNNVSYLASGESYTATAELKIPQGLVGQYKIIVWTDGDGTNHRSNVYPHQVVEDDDENNYGIARPIQINTPPLPDLRTINVVAPDEVFAGGQMTLNWRVENHGDGVTPQDQVNWVDKIYLSQNTTLDVNTDRLVGSLPRSGALAQNEGYTVSNFVMSVPNNIAGDWYVFILTDGDNQVYEFNNESNNANYDSQPPGSPMHIHATPPDLVIPTSVAAPANGSSGQSVSIGWTVKNQGAFDAAPNWFDAVYLSADQTLNTDSDVLLTNIFRSNPLGPGLTYDVSANVTLPSCISGTYYIFVLTDSRRQIFEFDPNLDAEANNASPPRSIQIVDATPDLRVTTVGQPSTGNAGQQINVNWAVANQGVGPTVLTKWTDRVYLSPTQTVDPGTALLIGSFDHIGALNSGENYTRTESLTIPSTAQGDYFVAVLTDANNEVEECANNANNVAAGAQMITIDNVLPDLIVQSANSQSNPIAGQTVSVDWTVANQGATAVNIHPGAMPFTSRAMPSSAMMTCASQRHRSQDRSQSELLTTARCKRRCRWLRRETTF